MKITLRNDFHNTVATVNADIFNGFCVLSKSQVKRVYNKLCGISDCTCSGVLGIRGRQSFSNNYGRFEIAEHYYQGNEKGGYTLILRRI